MMTEDLTIADYGRTYRIGHQHPVMIVAEISSNHGGDLHRAMQLVQTAKDVGAMAVKFQAYTVEEMVPPLSVLGDTNRYQIKDGLWRGRMLHDLYERGRTPLEWLPKLFQKARDIGLLPFASVFGDQSLKALRAVECPIFKLAHPELTDWGLLAKLAVLDRPIILSASDAMADMPLMEARSVINFGRAHVRDPGLVVLFTGNGYPSWPPVHRVNFGHLVGISDHSNPDSNEAATIATYNGAVMIERHLQLKEESPFALLDSQFSVYPGQFADMVRAIRRAMVHRNIAKMTGTPESAQWMRQLVYRTHLPKGTRLSAEHLRTARCRALWNGGPWQEGLGSVAFVVGRELVQPVFGGEPVQRSHLG